MRSGVGLGPVPGLCLLAKRRERRFPEAGQSIAKPRSADYPKIATGGICEAIAKTLFAFAAGRFGVLEIRRKLKNDSETPCLPISK